MDDRAALRLQLEWGIDEALGEAPVSRLLPTGPRAAPVPMRPAAAVPAPVIPAAPAPAVAATLAELYAAIAAFPCPLHDTAHSTVLPAGRPDTGLLLLGDAPGPDDDRSGSIFGGPTGAVLDRVLGSAGLGRDDMMLANVLPWRPPGGRPANEAEVALCLPLLDQLLTLTRPRILVLLGATPLRALFGPGLVLRGARGKWLDLERPGPGGPIRTLPMQPPDRWLATPTDRQNTWADLLTLKAGMRAPVSD